LSAPVDEDGVVRRGPVQGFREYLYRMRRQVRRSGVRIKVHHPAPNTPDGAVAGAAGVARQDGGAPWRVRTGAVVPATGRVLPTCVTPARPMCRIV